jgi:hypothetical protein
MHVSGLILFGHRAEALKPDPNTLHPNSKNACPFLFWVGTQCLNHKTLTKPNGDEARCECTIKPDPDTLHPNSKNACPFLFWVGTQCLNHTTLSKPNGDEARQFSDEPLE